MFTTAKYVYTNNNQKVETTKIFINRWMDKQNVVCPYDGILLYTATKKRGTCYNMNEPWTH